jgi:hypothetical protein
MSRICRVWFDGDIAGNEQQLGAAGVLLDSTMIWLFAGSWQHPALQQG